MAFSEQLKELRTQKDLTQEKLAKELGITTRSVINYEAGRRYPSVELLSRMAKFFKVGVSFLMDEQDEFIAKAEEQGGRRGKLGAKKLVEEVSGLFAGGELSETDKDAVMEALQEAYWIAKKNNKKYTPKKYLK